MTDWSMIRIWATLDHPQAVDAVSEGAAERPDQHPGKKIRERHEAEHGAGMAELPGEPADPDALHPGADQRHAVARDVHAELAMGQRARNVAQPVKRPHDRFDGSDPDASGGVRRVRRRPDRQRRQQSPGRAAPSVETRPAGTSR
jgi:hypothetical protein